MELWQTIFKELVFASDEGFNSCGKILKTSTIKILGRDDLSKEIWLPDNAHFNQVYDGQKLQVLALDPVSALVSKAVKAPSKNYSLIKRGLEIFGDALVKELEFYNISKDKFLKEPDLGI